VRELAAPGLVLLADKGYAGAGDYIRTPTKGRNKRESQKVAKFPGRIPRLIGFRQVFKYWQKKWRVALSWQQSRLPNRLLL
jgi:hypothetical protein